MADQGTILIVDDEEINIELLGSVLEEDYKIVFALDGEQALRLLETVQVDVILLDVMMPGLDGYETCARIKAGEDFAHIPVIFVTALITEEEEIRGFGVGAVDFIRKPFNASIVHARIRTHVELKRARDKLSELAITDALTGLANRRHFDEVLAAEYKRLRRSELLLSVILLDIDHFKAFNDTYGHPAGDECLRKVGGVLGQVVNRAPDLAARYGGEEFVCVLPETDLEGAMAVARRILTAIAALGIPHSGSTVANHVTASLGVVTFACSAPHTAMDIVAAADACLYQAKSEGRNRIATSDVE